MAMRPAQRTHRITSVPGGAGRGLRWLVPSVN